MYVRVAFFLVYVHVTVLCLQTLSCLFLTSLSPEGPDGKTRDEEVEQEGKRKGGKTYNVV